MTLNHLNLTVADPTETSAFLAKYFGLQPRGGNLGIQMLNDDRGMVLTLIKARRDDLTGGALRAEGAAGKPTGGEVKYPSSFHIGFIQPTHERVAVFGPPDECVARLRDVIDAGAGLLVLTPLFDHAEHLEVFAEEIRPQL